MMYGARVRDVIGRRIVGAPAVVVVPEAAAAGAPAAVLEGHDNDDFSVGWADDLAFMISFIRLLNSPAFFLYMGIFCRHTKCHNNAVVDVGATRTLTTRPLYAL